MKNKRILILLGAVMLLTLACGLPSSISGLVGGSKAAPVEQMWTDVPVMDGMEKAKLDLPLPARLAIQGFIKSSTQGDGALDFIAYTTTKQPKDVFDFYNNDMMTSSGWTMKDQPGCQADTSGSSNAGVCFFGKMKDNNSGSFLVIFVTGDTGGKDTSVFFIRVDAKDLPTQQP